MDKKKKISMIKMDKKDASKPKKKELDLVQEIKQSTHNFIEKEKKKSKNFRPRKFMDEYSLTTLYGFLIVSIAMVIFFLSLVMPDIFNNNLQGEMRLAVFVLLFIGGTIIWGIFALISPHSSYSKEFAFLIFLSVSMIWSNKIGFLSQHNILWGVIIGLALIGFSFIVKRDITPGKVLGMLTILLMLYVFLGGIIILNETFGYKPISAYLNLDGNAHNRYSLEEGIACSSFREKILVGMNVSCKINPSLKKIINANVTFTYNLGGSETIPLNENLTFIAPENVYLIFFQIRGFDEDDKEIDISSSWRHTFYTIEEDQKRREGFAKYFLGLLGLIFITIPLMINQFKELVKAENSHYKKN
ncbi:MAG: hypothetical protein ABFQ65_01575 [Nanoarchaeota archaeon]